MGRRYALLINGAVQEVRSTLMALCEVARRKYKIKMTREQFQHTSDKRPVLTLNKAKEDEERYRITKLKAIEYKRLNRDKYNALNRQRIKDGKVKKPKHANSTLPI